MSRIAIVDMLFTWPPDGGARTDIKEIGARLARDHEVKLFCPDYQQFFPRGRMLEPVDGLAVETVPFSFYTFNYHFVAERFRSAIDRFNPDRVLIADAWFMKPHIALALADYRPILRFYAYESLCLNRGSLWCNNQICQVDYPTLSKLGTFKCVLCALWGQKFRSDTQHGQEFWGARCFLPGYRDKTVEMLRSAGGLIVYNEFIADKVRRYNDRIRIIPSGVDAEHFRPAHRTVPAPPYHLAMVGRATDPIKGFKTLRAAATKLYQQRQDFNLLVTFKKEEAYFRQPFIEVAGWFSQQTLPQFYAQLDICVVPSMWAEPCGIVAVEAMATGKPVIVSKVGGLQHLVEEGETGFVVPAGDVDALSDRLTYLLDHPEERLRMGRRGRERVEALYTWDAIYDQHYRSIFESGSGLGVDRQ